MAGRRMDLATDFRDLLCALADHGVRFLVVGAYALAAHGRPRGTGATAWPNRLTARFDDIPVSLVGRDDFLANKRAVGRLKDLADARSRRTTATDGAALKDARQAWAPPVD